ncbi:MAG: PilZ domain-containing protein [Candidatus Omnitrophota bacterium]|nr:PilZ domain-containing protein [Candidatus Omnitrophota bacterium]
MKERRNHLRAKKYFAINIVACDSDGKHLRFDKIKANPKYYDESGIDFTPEGVKIMCSKPLPEESKIQMKMLIPDEENLNLIRANGTIKWFKQIKGKYKKYFIIGVNFRDLGADDKEKLIHLWKKYK